MTRNPSIPIGSLYRIRPVRALRPVRLGVLTGAKVTLQRWLLWWSGTGDTHVVGLEVGLLAPITSTGLAIGPHAAIGRIVLLASLLFDPGRGDACRRRSVSNRLAPTGSGPRAWLGLDLKGSRRQCRVGGRQARDAAGHTFEGGRERAAAFLFRARCRRGAGDLSRGVGFGECSHRATFEPAEPTRRETTDRDATRPINETVEITAHHDLTLSRYKRRRDGLNARICPSLHPNVLARSTMSSTNRVADRPTSCQTNGVGSSRSSHA